jgi:hypothetical protein
MMRRAGALAAALLTGCLAIACQQALAPSPAVETVDVLDFLIGDAALWPRVGSHYMNQIVDPARREVCWVKYFNPRRFECWRWDDAYVYHETDNAIDGNTGESYHFSDGRWMPRRLPIGPGGQWSLDVTANQLKWFTPRCAVDADRSGAFPYRQRAWFEAGVDAGGDLGIRDNIVLEYAPYDPATGSTHPERFYFARGAGWYRWQRGDAESLFLRTTGTGVAMNRDVWCTG